MFSNKKKFNIDDPDFLQDYWHNLQFDSEIYSKRVQEGRSVMIWGALSYYAVITLVVEIEKSMDATYYCYVLQNSIIEEAYRILREHWILQQGNAAVHTSNHTSTSLDFTGI